MAAVTVAVDLVPESGWKYGSLLGEASHGEMSTDPCRNPAKSERRNNKHTMDKTHKIRREDAYGSGLE